MKYKDLMYYLKLLEIECNHEFDRIDLVEKDFDSIVKELNINNAFISFTLNDIIFTETNEDKFLKQNYATFLCKFDSIKKGMQYTIFTTIEILSEEERAIKKILE